MKTCFFRWAVALLPVLWLPFAAGAQSVGIGTTVPDAKAALEIKASDRGLLIPRLTAAQRTGIAAPPQGLLVYQTDAPEGFYYVAGSPAAWVFLNPAGGGADNLGNHTATTGLNLQANALTGTGASIGAAVGVGVRADGGLNLGQNGVGNNVLLGFQAGQSLTPTTNGRGNHNQFIGYQSGLNNTTGRDNLFVGFQSGYDNTTGSFNCFNGNGSGSYNTTGSYNNFSGLGSGYHNTTGDNNQFSGYLSGYNNSTGSNNQFIGYQSGYNNSAGGHNVFNGYESGINNTTGNENVFLGYQSGQDNATGSYNTALGAYSGTYQNVVSNSTALGNGAIVTTSNTIQLGNSIFSLRCQVGLTVTSDARFKTDVQANVPGLAFITRLRPVTYRFDAARQAAFNQLPAGLARRAAAVSDSTRRTGFLAQDVEKVAQELGFDFDGLHAPANARDYYGLNYAQFVVPLVRAVQEQQAQIEALKQQATIAQAAAADARTKAAQATAATEAFGARLRRLENSSAQAQQ
ncbi:tail fiber domain-containing protein [Hymenobacter negativus]|uniref:Tail fiber domain-containing protein n=1 Tax=Hymenobacter negativus TaxID=2795026 RepID=A0ABS3QNW5_9BACT|nr:tail fiber domain-containing protein [Hymenobacter negativus]MBO2012972.1 tail fiber domain-containing protein [Hymenobacter negativus]